MIDLLYYAQADAETVEVFESEQTMTTETRTGQHCKRCPWYFQRTGVSEVPGKIGSTSGLPSPSFTSSLILDAVSERTVERATATMANREAAKRSG